jgi:hypothetical protein
VRRNRKVAFGAPYISVLGVQQRRRPFWKSLLLLISLSLGLSGVEQFNTSEHVDAQGDKTVCAVHHSLPNGILREGRAASSWRPVCGHFRSFSMANRSIEDVRWTAAPVSFRTGGLNSRQATLYSLQIKLQV